ncbi:MAG: GIY-YIG nuclease family protein [Victivallaceae bacterium]|nr:GIY-YIG nuclease family protein [Victivallaceae bacterium]
MTRAFSINIFLKDGDPEGLRIITQLNKTGVGVVFNRSTFAESRKDEHFGRPGVYVLVGSSEDSTLPIIYIGEAENILERLTNHNSKLDFWDKAIFFTTSNNSLNKAHIKYLEAKLYEIAVTNKTATLRNTQAPKKASLSTQDETYAENFLDDMLLTFPVVGLSVFEKVKKPAKKNKLLYIKAKNIVASGYETSSGFVVCKDSQVCSTETKSIHAYLSNTRKDLLKQGVLAQVGIYYIFTQDYTFNSPSTAAGVVQGRAANGRTDWKDKSGKSLKQLQEETTG